MDRGAWRATVPGVTKTRAQLSRHRHRQEEVEGGSGGKSSTKNLRAATLPGGLLQVPSTHSRRMPQNIPPSSVVPTCQPSQDHQHGQDASLGRTMSAGTGTVCTQRCPPSSSTSGTHCRQTRKAPWGGPHTPEPWSCFPCTHTPPLWT